MKIRERQVIGKHSEGKNIQKLEREKEEKERRIQGNIRWQNKDMGTKIKNKSLLKMENGS